jgi:TatD DNase family protein
MIDTHSHIYDPDFDSDRLEVVNRAIQAGVEKVLLANVDASTIEPMLQCHKQYPDFSAMAMGLHPTSVKEDWQAELRTIEDALRAANKYLSIGEIGLDLYWDKTFAAEQEKALEQQLDWAISLDLPVILHIRKAHAETFKVLNKFKGKTIRGVFHCFGGGVEEARKAVDMGFMLGIGGVVTYKNSNLGEIIAPIGLEHILLETDAPYLSPVPNRGKRNEPSNLVYIRDHLASIFQTNSQKVDEITTKNARQLFNFD